MKRAFLLLTFVLMHSLSVRGKTHSVISAESMLVAYTHKHNPLKVLAERIPCNALWLKCDNGTIVRMKDDCLFDFQPLEARQTTIYVCRIQGTDTVKIDSVWNFRVREYSEPMAVVIGNLRAIDGVLVRGTETMYLSGTITADSIHKLTKIITFIEGYDWDVEGQLPITNFTMTIVSDNNCKRLSSTMPVFSGDIKTALGTVKAGETVLFTNVIATPRDSKHHEPLRLQPLELNIK